jgi:hypothetical protein
VCPGLRPKLRCKSTQQSEGPRLQPKLWCKSTRQSEGPAKLRHKLWCKPTRQSEGPGLQPKLWCKSTRQSEGPAKLRPKLSGKATRQSEGPSYGPSYGANQRGKVKGQPSYGPHLTGEQRLLARRFCRSYQILDAIIPKHVPARGLLSFHLAGMPTRRERRSHCEKKMGAARRAAFIRKKRWLRDARGEREHAHHAHHAKHASYEKVPSTTPQRTLQRAHGVGTASAQSINAGRRTAREAHA